MIWYYQIQKYPSEFPQEFDLDYNLETKVLIVDYQFPSLEAISTLKEVKYVQSRDEFIEKHLTKSQANKIYDSILYQITLRTIHELYEADKADALDAIIFNGYVKSIDPATGQEVNSCVLSVQAKKEDFLEINLALVEPKACFRKLKGVGSSELHSLTPIPPIVRIERDDKRFVDSYEVVNSIDEGCNLAAMDWEDFEHLIRELFEQAFAEAGGEVKVTQASRDGGIDAIIIDPDPLRGGKIVVQAKRYTNVVGVSAVRDLYGALQHEGANKGILVTTSYYGPDAYEFIKGKPLQLIDGSNLLYLLEQQGHKARIDLKEAKKTLYGNES
ncbi:restriction endonuclease [Methanobacterium sp.]|uniref:restriction endonuclease n=1 Tax=Methanobacterium sp. TaxID=2164 RepID=UPI003C717463